MDDVDVLCMYGVGVVFCGWCGCFVDVWWRFCDDVAVLCRCGVCFVDDVAVLWMCGGGFADDVTVLCRCGVCFIDDVAVWWRFCG